MKQQLAVISGLIILLCVSTNSVLAQRTSVGRYAIIDKDANEIELVIKSNDSNESKRAYFGLGNSQAEVKASLKTLLNNMETSGKTFVWQGYSIQVTGKGIANILNANKLNQTSGQYPITRQIVTQAYIDIAAEKGWDIGHYRVVVKSWGEIASVQGIVDDLGGECTYSLGTTRSSYRSTDWFEASKGDVLTADQLAILKDKIENGVIIQNKETRDFLTLIGGVSSSGTNGPQRLGNRESQGIDRNVLEGIMQASGGAEESAAEEEEEAYMVVETMPEYPGGQAELFKFLSENVHYPKIAQDNGIQGRVICQFIVEKSGIITNVEVIRSGGDASLDQEAVRVIKAMPRWTPGTQRGKPVRVKYTVPVNFRLQ